MARRESVERFLPLKHDIFAVLLVLLEGERHGYGIMQDAAERSGGRVNLQPGALYRLLKRLLDDGLIRETERRPVETSGDERRRYYAVTPFGRDVARAEALRMAELVAASRVSKLLDEQPL